MAANVENMFYVGRVTPWHGLGVSVETAPTSEDALRLAGLDWQVIQSPVYSEGGLLIPGFVANLRDTDRKPLGIVTNKYKVVQNAEAFAFTDELVGETENGVVTYETAGSLREGKTIWLLAKMPQTKILGDQVDPYICFANTHDGSGAVRVCMTPIRVVCNNTLNIALSSAKRAWSTRHIGDLESKLEEAKNTLFMAEAYMKELDHMADRYAEAKLLKEQVDEIIDEMFPVDDSLSERKRNNIESIKANYQIAYFMPDIAQYRDTAWGAINAMSDFVTHAEPQRETSRYAENRWGKIMDGHAMMDQFVSLVNQRIAV